MKKVILLILVLNIVLSSAIFLRQRLKRRSRADSESSLHSSDDSTDIEFFNFSQKLDHFNSENNQWFQRSWFSTTHYRSGGPVFLLVNGEGSVDGNREFDEAWISYAKKLHALCFSLEHRYYGQSWPGTQNMHHLSVAQALADIANFIKTTNEEFKLPKNTKWIVFGCSYAGMLAAWVRLKYPHLIHGAVASSAPLESKVNFYGLWDYQVCSELGGFSSYNRTPSLSALSHLIPIEIDIKDRCKPFFSSNFGVEELNKKMIETNVLYGGLNFNVGNTLFIQGSTDPWYTSGLYKQKTESIYETIFINGASHCSDVYQPSDEDIPQVKKARKQILGILKKWLKK